MDYDKVDEGRILADGLFHGCLSVVTVMAALLITLLLCLLTSCKSGKEMTGDHLRYDSVYSAISRLTDRHDSVVYQERVVVQPHIIRVGDTTIVKMDTTIVRNTTRNVYSTISNSTDQGRIVRDTAYVERKVPVKASAAKAEPTHKWRAWWLGVIVGVLLAVAVKYRKKIFNVIARKC